MQLCRVPVRLIKVYSIISTLFKGRIPEVIPIEGIRLQPDFIDGENRTDHKIGNSVPHSLRQVRGFRNFPQFYEH